MLAKKRLLSSVRGNYTHPGEEEGIDLISNIEELPAKHILDVGCG